MCGFDVKAGYIKSSKALEFLRFSNEFRLIKDDKETPEYVVKDGSTEKLKLKALLSKCGRTSVENEVEYIRKNVLEIFVREEE